MLHPVEGRLLRGAGVPTAGVALGIAAAGLVVAGPRAAAGALLGGIIVVVFFGAGLTVSSWTRRRSANEVMAWVLLGYAAKIIALGVMLVLFGDTQLFDTTWFAGTVLAGSVTWLGGEVRTFTRLQLLYVEPEAAAQAPDARQQRPA